MFYVDARQEETFNEIEKLDNLSHRKSLTCKPETNIT